MTAMSKDAAHVTSRVSRHTSKYQVEKMTIEIMGAPEAPASGVHTKDQASDTTLLITEAQVALGTAAATGVRRKNRRWIVLLSRIFMPAPKASRPKRRPYPPRMTYLDYPRMAREMERL
jgi:hypothetical protein